MALRLIVYIRLLFEFRLRWTRMKNTITLRLCAILTICLVYLSSCTSRTCNKYNSLSRSIATVWRRDSCGFIIGDRAAIANIYNDYINNQWPRPKLKEIKKALGDPNEIRDYSDDKVHWYFYIGVKICGSLKTIDFVRGTPGLLFTNFYKQHCPYTFTIPYFNGINAFW